MHHDPQTAQHQRSHPLSTKQRSSAAGQTEPAGDASESLLEGLIEGLIVDGSRGLYRVETPRGEFTCTIRGKLRKELTYAESGGVRHGVRAVAVKPHDPVAVGDRVYLLPIDTGRGVIERVIARAGGGGAFARRDPDPKQGTLRTVAGLDQIVPVFATRDPEPRLGLLDRMLVVAEAQRVGALICVTKLDLGLSAELAARLDVYQQLGYPVLYTSATTGEGIDALRARLAGKVSALVGKSGVGKSSLLNALLPDAAQTTAAVSGATGKGRHTTTAARLFALGGPDGGYLADTAGIRALGLERDAEDALDWCFVEFRRYLDACERSDCAHLDESGCAVRAAVAAGAIDAERYASYRRLREAADDD